MGVKGEALARRFEAKVEEAAAVVEALSDADWAKMTEAEKWTVGVTAHHLAGAFEPVAGWCAAIAAGQSVGDFTGAMLDEMNVRHARDHARCTKAETLALLRNGAAAAAAVVRGMTDDQLAMSAPVFSDALPMTVEQLVNGGLILHAEDHLRSIRKAVVG